MSADIRFCVVLASTDEHLFLFHLADLKLKEHSVDETEVTKIAAEVAVSKREAEIVSAKADRDLPEALQLRYPSELALLEFELLSSSKNASKRLVTNHLETLS